MNIGQLQAAFETYEDRENYTPASFCEKFSKLLHVEELQMEVDIAKYQMENAKLNKPKERKDQNYLALNVPGLAEKRPSLVRGDQLLVRKVQIDGSLEKTMYQGYIHRVELNEVFLKFSAK